MGLMCDCTYLTYVFVSAYAEYVCDAASAVIHLQVDICEG